MIPKIIHYCWFGGNPLPELAERCIASWKHLLPDYEILRWDEGTYDLSVNDYVKEAFEAKKWAFVTDYVRLDVLYKYGGIYMDTDVEVIKPLDCFLKHHAFSGFENVINVPTGIMASEKGNQTIKDQLDMYTGRHFLLPSGDFDLTTNVSLITNYFLKKGLHRDNSMQVIDGYALYPNIYFCPYKHEIGTRYFKEDTYTIHHKYGSWIPSDQREIYLGESFTFKLKEHTKRLLLCLLGKKTFDKLLIRYDLVSSKRATYD